MKHVVIDLEMNPIHKGYKYERRCCPLEIIQIGAVVLDENYNEIASFSTLVKPVYNDWIEPTIVDLTGITTQMVERAPVFHEAIHSFFAWIKNIQDEVEILSWSNNDLNQIISEAYLKEYEFSNDEDNLLDNWFDFQDEYRHTLLQDQICSLSSAIKQANLTFQGNEHDALYDAKNTANLLSILRNESKRNETYGSVMKYKEVSSCTLGDLFDFSSFVFD